MLFHQAPSLALAFLSRPTFGVVSELYLLLARHGLRLATSQGLRAPLLAKLTGIPSKCIASKSLIIKLILRRDTIFSIWILLYLVRLGLIIVLVMGRRLYKALMPFILAYRQVNHHLFRCWIEVGEIRWWLVRLSRKILYWAASAFHHDAWLSLVRGVRLAILIVSAVYTRTSGRCRMINLHWVKATMYWWQTKWTSS